LRDLDSTARFALICLTLVTAGFAYALITLVNLMREAVAEMALAVTKMETLITTVAADVTAVAVNVKELKAELQGNIRELRADIQSVEERVKIAVWGGVICLTIGLVFVNGKSRGSGGGFGGVLHGGSSSSNSSK
jgi:hypothetical protein